MTMSEFEYGDQSIDRIPDLVPIPYDTDPEDLELEKLNAEVDEIIEGIKKEQINEELMRDNSHIEPKIQEKCNVCRPLISDHDIELVIKKPFENPNWKPSEMCRFSPESMWDIVLNCGRRICVNCDHYMWTEFNSSQTSHSVFVPCRFTCEECNEKHPGVRYTFSALKIKSL